MAHGITQAGMRQVQLDRQKLEKSEGLPFRELLSEDRILEALARAGVEFRDRIYTPMVTLWTFLSQVMDGKESSCQKAVSRVKHSSHAPAGRRSTSALCRPPQPARSKHPDRPASRRRGPPACPPMRDNAL